MRAAILMTLVLTTSCASKEATPHAAAGAGGTGKPAWIDRDSAAPFALEANADWVAEDGRSTVSYTSAERRAEVE